jgi:GTPase SAR1 family protein
MWCHMPISQPTLDYQQTVRLSQHFLRPQNLAGMTKELNCKVVLLGKESTGKSCLVKRFIQDDFEYGHPVTVGASYAAKRVIWTNPDCARALYCHKQRNMAE